jgi:hypothetical protein
VRAMSVVIVGRRCSVKEMTIHLTKTKEEVRGNDKTRAPVNANVSCFKAP